MKDQKQTTEVAETAATAAAEATWPQTRAVLRVIFIVIAVYVIWWIVKAVTSVILLVVLSIFFAYLVAPLVEFVRRPFKIKKREHMMPRVGAIAIVYVLIFGSLGLAVRFLVPRISDQISQFISQAPTYFTSAKGRAQALQKFYQEYNLPQGVRDTIKKNLESLIDTASEFTTSTLGTIIYDILHVIPWLILIPILAFFLLKDVDSFRRSALQMLPRGRWRWRGDEFFQDVNRTLAAYVRAQLIASLLIGTVCTIGFLIIGVPYALLLGLLAGILEFIPLVGPLVVAVIATLIASFYSFNQAIAIVLFLGILRIIHDYVTYPRIIGQGIHLHPLAVILAILSGAEIGGIAGIFLAIPVVAIATVSYRHWQEHRGGEGLVAELLKPAEQIVTAPASGDAAVLEAGSAPRKSHAKKSPPREFTDEHPSRDSTPEDMARARPDLTTGELRLKDLE